MLFTSFSPRKKGSLALSAQGPGGVGGLLPNNSHINDRPNPIAAKMAHIQS